MNTPIIAIDRRVIESVENRHEIWQSYGVFSSWVFPQYSCSHRGPAGADSEGCDPDTWTESYKRSFLPISHQELALTT